MPPQPFRSVLTVVTLILFSTSMATAQSGASTEIAMIPVGNRTFANSIWPEAQHGRAYTGKVFVVTSDRPDHRHACHIQSITADKLTCSRGIVGPRTYLRRQVVALIIPGDASSKPPFVLGFNIGLGAAIWGTVVLAVPCPPCAVATGIVAFALFGGAGAVLIADDQPDRLLYLAPGQQLLRKLGFVER